MIKTILLSMCLAASLLSLDAGAQDTLNRDALAQNDRQYTDGPVTEVDYLQIEYGHFAEYIDWLNSTWKPTMEAMKKAGIIIDYKVFQATPKSLDQPNIFLYLTFKNMAAYGGNIGDKGIEQEYVARNVIRFHSHQNEQTGYILSGRIRVLTRDSRHELDPGDTYAIPANIEHSIEIVEDAEEVQVFTPPREDFR